MIHGRLLSRLLAALRRRNTTDKADQLSRVRRRHGIGALITLALLATLAVPASQAKAQDAQVAATASHVFVTNDSNQRAFLALRPNGTFQLRHNMANSWSGYVTIHGDGWTAGDVAILGNGDIHVVAVNGAGELYTQVVYAAGGQGPLTLITSGLDPTTAPSIAANSTELALATIESSGALYTHTFTGTWGGSVGHGYDWVDVDIDLADDGDIWFAATKTNGALKVRHQILGDWLSVVNMGAATWSLDAPPAISATSSDGIIAAVKADGHLYTRRQVADNWQGWINHGNADWSSADVAIAPDGGAWLAGVKNFGRLFTRETTTAGTWLDWDSHGLDTWATTASPSVSLFNTGGLSFLAVKADGTLYARAKYASSWSGWHQMSNAPWETGAPIIAPTPDSDPEPPTDGAGPDSAGAPPEWVDDAEVNLDWISPTEFQISWGATRGAPTELWITLTDSAGNVSNPEFVDPRVHSSWKIDSFNTNPLDPDDNYDIDVYVANANGQSDVRGIRDMPLLPVAVENVQFISAAAQSDSITDISAIHSSDPCGGVKTRFTLKHDRPGWNLRNSDDVVLFEATSRVCTDGHVITTNKTTLACQLTEGTATVEAATPLSTPPGIAPNAPLVTNDYACGVAHSSETSIGMEIEMVAGNVGYMSTQNVEIRAVLSSSHEITPWGTGLCIISTSQPIKNGGSTINCPDPAPSTDPSPPTYTG